MPPGYQIQSFLRIASISVALYDYLETFPTTWRFYHEQLSLGRLTMSCALFMSLRISSIVVLCLSSFGFFYDGFDEALCSRFFLLPPIFKVVQIMVSQAILGVRVYNLSKRSRPLLYVGLFMYLATNSLQWVTTLIQREPDLGNKFSNCRAFSRHGELGAWIFYAIAMAYDIIMTFTSIVYLIKYKLMSSTGSMMGRLVNMMLYDGLGYLVALTAINVLNLLLYKTSQETQSAAASLGYCITWIMSQRLLIHLHDASRERRMESEDAEFTVSQDVLSPRAVSEMVRGPLVHKPQSRYEYQHQLPHPRADPDVERTFHHDMSSEDFNVHVRVERTMKVERQSRTLQLEDYTRRARRFVVRNVQTRH